jgi:hypothetical protein
LTVEESKMARDWLEQLGSYEALVGEAGRVMDGLTFSENHTSSESVEGGRGRVGLKQARAVASLEVELGHGQLARLVLLILRESGTPPVEFLLTLQQPVLAAQACDSAEYPRSA